MFDKLSHKRLAKLKELGSWASYFMFMESRRVRRTCYTSVGLTAISGGCLQQGTIKEHVQKRMALACFTEN